MKATAAFIPLVFLASVGCHPTPRPPQFGITATVTMTDRVVHEGELLAVHRDSLVLAVGGTLRWLPMDRIERARIDRRVHGIGPSVRGTALGGLGSGFGLMIACMSAEADGCIVILPAVIGASLIIGFLGGLETERFRYETFASPTTEQLRPWARYPQGMPEGLGGGPPE